jgi:PKHD-type hydroxylase
MKWLLDGRPVYNHAYWSGDGFTKEECEKIIEIGKRRNQIEGLVGDNDVTNTRVDKAIRRGTVAWIEPTPETEWIYKKLTDIVYHANKEGFKQDLNHIDELQFATYDQSNEGFYRKHVDTAWENPERSIRKLSIVVQLTDPAEYEGGELKLHTAHDPDIMDKEQGKVIIFPSWTLHEVTPVTSGTRRSMVAWVCGPTWR